MSFQTSGSIFFSFGLGRDAVRPAVVARPVPREGPSAARIPVPKLADPMDADIWLKCTP
jgi:hypothetical protein